MDTFLSKYIFRSTNQAKDDGILAYDFAVSFALKNQQFFIFYFIIACLVHLVIECLHYYFALAKEQLFLLFVIETGLNSWMLLSVFMTTLTIIRGNTPDSIFISSDALRDLAKVFLSYLLLIGLIISMLFLIPLFPFAILFVYAPLFCCAELFAERSEQLKYGSDEDELSFYDDEDSLWAAKTSNEAVLENKSFFKDAAIWDLGFIRSANFSIKQLNITILLVCTIWFGNVAAPVVSSLLFSYFGGFIQILGNISLASFFDLLTSCIIVGAFLALIPKTALEEIGVAQENYDLAFQTKSVSTCRLQQNKLFFLFLFGLSSFGTYLFLDIIRGNQEFPDDVKLKVNTSEVVDDKLLIEVVMQDDVRHFRWLQDRWFAISFDNSDNTNVSENSKVASKEPIKAIEVVPFDEEKTITKANYVPFYKQLRLRIYFAIPPDMKNFKNFELYYVVPEYQNKLIYKGQIGS